jgi:hypothetical protein
LGHGVSNLLDLEKQAVFGQKLAVVKWNWCLLWLDKTPRPQKGPKLDFQSHFSMSKNNGILKKKHFNDINLGEYFFLNLLFWLQFSGILFSKIRPNFCRPHAMSIYKIQQFHLTTVDFWVKNLLFWTHQVGNLMTFM